MFFLLFVSFRFHEQNQETTVERFRQDTALEQQSLGRIRIREQAESSIGRDDDDDNDDDDGYLIRNWEEKAVC